MSIRLNFIVEGQTEEAFVNQILSPLWKQHRPIKANYRRNTGVRKNETIRSSHCCGEDRIAYVAIEV